MRSPRLAILVPFAVLLTVFALPLAAQTPVTPLQNGQPWWKHAVLYELYPRSFADSNNDGVGDLRGIAAKLDYLQKLGVDAIWITPCYPSPQKDFGYDVSDYVNIDPMYGTLADFDYLQKEAGKRGIRIIMDFVINHSSDQHPWFIDSRSSRTSAHRDWYIWRDGKGPSQPPNNWLSDFGGSAWTYDPTTGQYYYHYFEVQQPDLNWRNPVVEKAMFDVTRFWYRHGVAGFRLDAVDTLFEDPQLRDNPVRPGKNEFGDPQMDNIYNDNLPENHLVLKRLRKLADENDAVLIGETWTKDIAGLRQYYGDNNDEIQLPMDFLFTTINKLSAPDFRKQIALVESSGGWPVYTISNHDMARSYNRYGDGKNNDPIAKLMAGMYLTLRGTPILYYGEELGMENNDPTRKEDVKDPLGISGWPENKGRDGERTPMQWDATPNAGFTKGTPWLPVAANYTTHNVKSETADKDSILNFYTTLLQFRRRSAALLDGAYIPLNENDANVLSYLRQANGETILVALNFSPQAQVVKWDTGSPVATFARARTILSTTEEGGGANAVLELHLKPFSVYIAQLEK
jgi:alpha-glucosidase